MSDPVAPSTGARYWFEFVRGEPTHATYRLRVLASTVTAETLVMVYAEVSPAFPDGVWFADEAGLGAHYKTSHTLAKLLARGAAGRQAEGLAVWPSRMVRWRGPGRGV